MKNIKYLLSQVAVINKKNAEILDATGGRFNMFKICGVNHYENTHSGIIAEFLNPNGTHGLKSKLIECFIETLGQNFTIQKFNCEKSNIRTEYSTDEGRIDILIEDNDKKAIIIENKIYAADQPEQLKRYNRYAQTYKNGYQILYLTLFGHDATLQSCEGVEYLPISHKYDIINWLEKCVAISSRYPIVRETIIQYINHLKQLTNQDMDSKNKEEITEVLSNIENLRAAKVIVQNYSATYSNLAEKYFNPKMEEFAKQKGLNYHFEQCDELYLQFYFTKAEWEDKCWIGFTVEGHKTYYGVCNNPDKYKVSEENKKIIHEHLKNIGVSSRKESTWWPFYAYYPSLSLDVWENEIVNSNIFSNQCKQKIEEILEALEKVKL